MSESLREKLGYLNSELDDIRHLRSLSATSFSSRKASRSPVPPRIDVSTGGTPLSPLDSTPVTPKAFDSRPDIAAWPAPPPAARVLSKPGLCKSNQSNLQFRSTGTSPIPESQFQASTSTNEESKLLQLLRATPSYSPSRGGESELRKKIQNLEETVAEYERQKFNVMGTFSEYRDYVVERERTLEAEYSNKIIALSDEVLSAKKDFEARMKSFQSLQEQFEQEKEQALENLRQEHQKEIELLERRVAGSQLLNLEQKYIIEIRRLEDERKSLQTEKDRLGESFDTKLRRAQSLYETQLSAAKMLYVKELDALRDHEKHLKEELTARHEEFRDRVQELKLQSKQSREEVAACKSEIKLLQKKLKQKENELEFITKDLENARTELRASMRKLREVDAKLVKTQEELSEKETELNRKAELLESAESTRSRLESTIRKLNVEVKALKNKVDFLEIERDNLKCQSESQAHLQNTQVQALEAVLESVTKEKETSKEHYEKLLEQEREQAEKREVTLRQELCSKFNELEEQYNLLKDFVDTSDSFGTESGKLLEEVEFLRAQKNHLEEEVNELKVQLSDEKDKAQEKKEPSLNYVLNVLRSVDTIRKNINEEGADAGSSSDDEKILDVSVKVLRKELVNELNAKDTEKKVQLDVLMNKLSNLEKGVRAIVEQKNQAKSKVQKLEEENRQLALMIEQSSAVQSSRAALENSEMSLVKAKLDNAVVDLENERSKNRKLEIQLRHNEELAEEMGAKAKQLRTELEEQLKSQYQRQEKNMSRRLSDLQDQLIVKEEEERRHREILTEREEELKASDSRNLILKEMLRYKHGDMEDVLDDVMNAVGTNIDRLTKEELYEVFDQFDQLKRPEKEPVEQRHIETSTKPEVREMCLQANIVVVEESELSENEVVQNEIIGMLGKLMNTNPSELSDLIELKEMLQTAAEKSAGNRLTNLLQQISDRREKRSHGSKKEDLPEISRSRSPSLLTRLRERTPSKSKQFESGLSTSASTSRFLDSSGRKRYSKDGSRPAWKF